MNNSKILLKSTLKQLTTDEKGKFSMIKFTKNKQLIFNAMFEAIKTQEKKY